jgi:hypothetical protein
MGIVVNNGNRATAAIAAKLEFHAGVADASNAYSAQLSSGIQ